MKTVKIPAAGPERDEYYMNLAIREARKALKHDDVPIGCIIVYDGTNPASKADQHAASLGIEPGTILGRGYNRRNKDRSALMHAEVIAIRQACRALEDWRVEDCTMYVTLEPCPMCAGAIVLARVDAVVWGVSDPKRGGGTTFGVFDHPGINHHPEVVAGVLEEPCRAVLVDFFRRRRAEREAAKAASTPEIRPVDGGTEI